MDVDLMKLWVEEVLIESNLVLDTFFLVYYENFSGCKGAQWKGLCTLFKGMISGEHIGELAESSEGQTSFYHAKVQLALLLIETLDLENLLRMVHDNIPFRNGSKFSLTDIQEMDALVSSIIPLETAEAGPLTLSWGVFLSLLISLPEKEEYCPVLAIDIPGYIQNANVCGSFIYLMEVLQGDLMLNSEGPVSGYLSVLKTFISAFVTCFEIIDQSEGNISDLILEILCKIYRGEESLCKQFWDRDSFIDQPIRSFLYSLETEFPYNTSVMCLLSALCEGPWPAECVFNFLSSMTFITSPYEVSNGCREWSSDMIIIAPCHLPVEGFDLLSIPCGSQGQIVRIINDNTALVRWKVSYSSITVLLLILAQDFHSKNCEDVSLALDLLYRMCHFSRRICFTLMEIHHSSILQFSQSNGDADTTLRMDLVKVICSLASRLVRQGDCAKVMALCINILGEMLKCSPSYVAELTLRTSIFGRESVGLLSGSWILSGGLAKMVLEECEHNVKLCSLTIAVLDFSKQLVEIGSENDLLSSLLIFALQYVLVNHENWNYKYGSDRWKVSLKVFELIKSYITTSKDSSKLSSLLRELLFCDSSVHSMLTRVICIKSKTLESLCTSRLCDSREVESLLHCIHSALDAVSSILMDLIKGTGADIATLVNSLLTPSAKSVPVITATASLISFFPDDDVQVSAARLLSRLCSISPTVQQYSSENIFNVLDDAQLQELSTSMHKIIIDGETKSEELLTSVMNLLTSAAYFQPAFFMSIFSPLEELATSDGTQPTRTGLLKSLLQYLDKSDDLYERSPRLLLCVLNVLRALWKGNIQYVQILENTRKYPSFWKVSSFPKVELASESSPPEGNPDDNDGLLRKSYRYRCEAVMLDIIARDIFLHKDILGDVEATNNLLTSESSGSLKAFQPKDVSGWFVRHHLENYASLFSSCRFPAERVHSAKMEGVLLFVRMMGKISSGDHGSLSLSLIQQILSVSKKLKNHPGFLSLLEQYAVRRYSQETDVSVLVLSDLYYHMKGELEGRDTAPGPFKEVFQFLLEVDPFKKYTCRRDGDTWQSEDDNYMFDLARLRKELGLDLWEHGSWKSCKPQAETVLSLMHLANSEKFLAYSKKSSLGALTSLLSVCMKYMEKTKPKAASFLDGISEEFLQTSIEQLSQCIQSSRDAPSFAMSPSEEPLQFLSIQVELLLSLFKSLSIIGSRVQLLPIYILLFKTSDIALRRLSDCIQSEISQNATKFSLTLLLTVLESIHRIFVVKLKSDDEQYTEVSLLSLGLLPILCKYAENSMLSDLSLAAIDLIVKGPVLTSTSWLPVLQNHLHLQLIIHNLSTKDRLTSIHVIPSFLLTLARLKGGAQMLYKADFFQCLKTLISLSEDLGSIWCLAVAFTESMIVSLGDDSSCSDLVTAAIRYFYPGSDSMMYGHLSLPSISSNDDRSKKKPRTQKARTSLTALKGTEQALMLTCRLAKYHRLWMLEMREKNSELRERMIHMLAFISKTSQPPLFCPPTLKEEYFDHEKPSYIGSILGWFSSSVNRSRFSDTVAIHMYRIAFHLLEFLCIQATTAAKRAEEVGYVDPQLFPELPMPEILHGIQDQSIGIVTEICAGDKTRGEIEIESQQLCRLLLRILERTLYLEICVSQVCGIRPIMARTEDFSKEIRLLAKAADARPFLKPSIESLAQILPLLPSKISL
ncbi:nucleoporin (DUF3414) isoform X2 [Wolffia australiana]